MLGSKAIIQPNVSERLTREGDDELEPRLPKETTTYPLSELDSLCNQLDKVLVPQRPLVKTE